MNADKRRLTRAEAKSRTREALLDAAATTFARKGFSGASVEDIAEAAGFSIGALYSNFSGKEQLFLELLSTRANGQIMAAAEILDDATSEEPLDAISRMLVDIADKDMDFAPLQAEFWLYAVRNPEAMDLLAERMREPREAMKNLVAEGMRRRDSATDVPPETVSTVVFALFQGLVRQRRIDPASVSPELFGQALRWLLAGLEADAKPRKEKR